MSYFPPQLTTYTPTLTNATASGDTTICSFVVPGGTWADGEMITCRIAALVKNNSGVAQSTAIKVNATGGSAVTILTPSLSDSASEFARGTSIECMRVGANIAVILNPGWNADSTTTGATWVQPSSLLGAAGSSIYSSITPTNFTSDVTVSIIINLAATYATYYVKPQSAMCMKSVMRIK